MIGTVLEFTGEHAGTIAAIAILVSLVMFAKFAVSEIIRLNLARIRRKSGKKPHRREAFLRKLEKKGAERRARIRRRIDFWLEKFRLKIEQKKRP